MFYLHSKIKTLSKTFTWFPSVKMVAKSFEHNHRKNIMIVSYLTQYSRYIQKKKGLILESDQKNMLKTEPYKAQSLTLIEYSACNKKTKYVWRKRLKLQFLSQKKKSYLAIGTDDWSVNFGDIDNKKVHLNWFIPWLELYMVHHTLIVTRTEQCSCGVHCIHYFWKNLVRVAWKLTNKDLLNGIII